MAGQNIYIPFTGEFKGQADPTIASEWVVSEEFCQYMLYQALIKMDAYYELPEPDMAVALKQEFMLRMILLLSSWNGLRTWV